jgi:hypothetical protein
MRRALADLSCRALQATLPRSLKPWARAVRNETAGIEDDTDALLFALGSLAGLLPSAVASHLHSPFASGVGEDAAFSGGSTIAALLPAIGRRPRALGIACAICAVALGLAYMTIAGAPRRYLGINFGALLIGLMALTVLGHTITGRRRWAGGAIVAMAVALLATALLGDSAEGARRWVTLGGLAIQPSLILLPLMLVGYAQLRNAVTTLAVVAAAAAMALQPDRAMAGMLAACLTVLAIIRPDRRVVTALTASIIGFAATLARADTLPAAPYVDQVLFSAFDVHPAAGASVLGGSIMLLVPAIVGWWRDPDHRPAYAVFGIAWCAALVASSLGNYPTPIVGYGGSAVIGYLLSLLALPKLTGAVALTAPDARVLDTLPRDRHLLAGLA